MKLKQMVAFEGAMWRSLGRWVFRRRRVGPDEQAFGYAGAIMPVLWTFVVVSAIELVAVHLIIPWTGVRIALDVLGVWGVLWMLGLVGAVRSRPHAIGPQALRIRNSFAVEFTVPWTAIESAAANLHSPAKSRSVQLHDDTVEIVVGGQTTVDLRLRHPVTIDLPQGPASVTRIRCHADKPAAFVAAIRERVAATLDDGRAEAG